MKNQTVYDLPMRLFHWLFAGLFVVAFAIAKTIDDDSPIFTYHMLAGLIMGYAVLLRVLWGFVGSKYSKFNSFAFSIKDLLAYFSGILSGSKRTWAGHNPASSWASITMFALALGLGTTGYLMASGQKETFEDVHELMANGFVVIAIMHVTGILLHMIRHQDGIAMSMLHGKKSNLTAADGISSSSGAAAVLFAVLVLSFSTHLISNFNNQKQTLQFFGTTLELGEGGDGAEQGDAEDND